MNDAVESLYEDLSEVSRSLLAAQQPSLRITLEDIHRKSLLLAAASYFEFRVSESVVEFCKGSVGENSPVLELIRSKAVSRQYHTWFDWDSGNANRFFSLFGKDFKKKIEGIIKTDNDLAASVKEFISIGSDRNRLVHQNFGAFSLESTPDEIMEKYRSARGFVDRIPELLSAHSGAA